LRAWLLSRAVGLRPAATVRALVPVAVADLAAAPPPGTPARRRPVDPGVRHSTVHPLLVDLPVGEPDPVLRLAQLRYAMASHKATGRAVSADELAELAGFAPPTMHLLGARAASELTRRLFSLVITNVPGPQVPLYAAGARMSEMFPFLPLAPGQALSVALTSYDGGVYFGVNADYDAVPDAAAFADLIEQSLAELVATIGPDGAGRSRRATEGERR
jgi:diacylglycerol O-acyltransferase